LPVILVISISSGTSQIMVGMRYVMMQIRPSLHSHLAVVGMKVLQRRMYAINSNFDSIHRVMECLRAFFNLLLGGLPELLGGLVVSTIYSRPVTSSMHTRYLIDFW
jgi:hypothetical protein